MRIKTVEISDAVADVLRRSTWQGSTLMLPAGQLERKLYEGVDKVIKALGGKWNKHAGGHIFQPGAAVDIDRALDEGAVVDQKKTMEQFFTPADLARRMVEVAGIESGHDVLEPSAGGGALIEAIAAKHPATTITAIELDPALYSALHAKWGLRAQIFAADFLAMPRNDRRFDRVVMNPPFSAVKDIAHVQRAFGLLRPSGRLAAIMSPHFTFATDELSAGFRRLIGWPDGIRLGDQTGIELQGDLGIGAVTVETLPAGTFKASGTNIVALLVTIEKAA